MKTDVCLVVEGSYPYVVGGVSTWCHNLIRELPDLKFSVLHIGVSKHTFNPMCYRLPDNVVGFQEVYLLDPVILRHRKLVDKRAAFNELRLFVQELEEGRADSFERLYELFLDEERRKLTPHDVLFSHEFFDILVDLYERHCPKLSFVHYFWTCRFILMPIFQAFYGRIPEAQIYHASCTGYAGLMSAIGKLRNDAAMILTEHGIYTNERLIEISDAEYIHNEREVDLVPDDQLGILQTVWLKAFDLLGRIAYRYADRITTLYEGNRQMQIAGGAPPEKCEIIANGIDITPYLSMSPVPLSKKGDRIEVALVGRVAPIKDVKTYLRAARIVCSTRDDVIFKVYGPMDEDPEYAEECYELRSMLGLERQVEFTGSVRMRDRYPYVDIMVLTSLSEGQPFVVLEAMAAGIPIVSTNVGACPDLLLGTHQEDQTRGEAGRLTNIGSPDETAAAILQLCQSPELRTRMGQIGRARVQALYQRRTMLDRYRRLYEEFLIRPRAGAVSSA